jgi:PKD repeat protein
MVNTGLFVVRARRAALVCAVLAALFAVLAAPDARAQGEGKRVMLYTGTTGFRHTDAINNGRPVVQTALEGLGYTVDWEDCDNNGGAAGNCDNADKNPRIFSAANLERYDAIVFLNASWSWAGGGRPGPLLNEAQRNAVIAWMQDGGGIAAVHNSTDMGAGQSVWDWWDGSPNSVIGTTMPGHSANSTTGNAATVMVEDHHHQSTRDLPDTFTFADEHYNYARNVRGGHHVLANFDERTYNTGSFSMGQDHPITWCKLYEGDNVNDGTPTPKSYSDGRTWNTGMGHNGVRYTEDGGDNNLVKMIVGGIRWVAGEGRKSDCSGTVWSNFTRTVLVPDANGPIGIDVAKDGKVYWTEIGPTVGFESEGFIKMHDPAGAAGNKTTVATIPTRADHGNSEDGVLGMSLEPGFDLADPQKRDVFVYYSPRPGPGDNWPTSGNQQTVGYNQISRFTINAAGTAVEAGSERVILRVPKAKIAGSPSGFPGGPTDSGPGHVGGAGLDFDSDGNLYLGVGDDVSPNAPGHSGYPPMDHRASERWDARKTSANSNDLRGKIVRVRPLDDIPAGTNPGVDATYAIPEGNMFAPGTANTRPEIYAMGFRQPFTVHTDPANPGTVVTGEYCHDNSSNGAQRAPAGICEWNLLQQPGFHGWPFCMGNNSPENTSFRWNYAANATTGSQYDCSLSSLPSDINYAPAGQTPAAPTFQGLENLPGPAVPATIWKKYPGASGGQSAADFGDLSAGGMQPITGPIYRYDEETAGPGAFPPYYDGSWLINNRGSDSGFWKEVRLREDNNQMLHVHDWLPYDAAGSGSANFNSLVIGTQFGPDGALYMARYPVTCCRNNTNPGQQTQIVKIEFNVQDECLADEQAPNVSHEVTGQRHPDEPDTYVNSASLRLTASDVGCAGVDTVEYRVNGETDWHEYTGPVAFEEQGDYTVEYRATDRMENVSTVRTAAFSVVDIADTTAPTVTEAVEGSTDQRGFYIGSATLTLTADDGPVGSGVDTIEYRIGGGEWVEYSAPVSFDEPGAYTVDFRATDNEGNTSEPETIELRVISGEGCTATSSDEFNGSALDARWLRHTRNGGTPESGPMAPTVANGQLTMPTNDFELDGASATTAGGPVNFIGLDLPSLGNAWEVETQFTATHTGGWQGIGLMLWQADNNLVRSTITHNLGNGTIFIEQSKDNPTSPEGARQQSSGNPTILPGKAPVTIRMRYRRAEGANTVTSQYRVIAPASAATPDWVDFPGIANGLDLNPAGGPRRDAAGSRVGLYAGGNFPGTTGNHPYPGTPATMVVDYFKVTPDQWECEEDAPVTEAALDPSEPGPGGTYDGPVDVTLTASDVPGAEPPGADPFGMFEATALAAAEHRVDAVGALWEPEEVEAVLGDVVTWHFDAPDAQFPHDVWLVPPGGNPDPAGGDIFQVTSGPVSPGGPPVSHTMDAAGSWTYVCRLHSGFSGGQWTGMVGTAAVTEPGGGPGEPAGVDYTEYRVNTDGGTGEWVRSENGEGDDPFATSFTVSEAGQHTVEYRSVDNAGNEEAVKSVAFGIGDTEPGAPIVRGFADPSSGAAPLHVRFSSTALDPDGGPVSYRWSLEGVGNVLDSSFEHTFTTAGEYTATVTVTDDEGDTASDTVTVTVGGAANQAPTVDATADATSGAAPLAVRFHSLGNDPDGPENDLTYAWDFGDGGASFEQDPRHTYLEPGTYTATVTVEDAGGASGTDTVQITVGNPPGNRPPTVEAAVLPGSGPAPLEVQLSAQGTDPDRDPLTYQWSFGDGSSPGSGRTVRHTYEDPGTYTATVTASDGRGGTGTAEVDVVVGDPPGNQAPTVEAVADPRSGSAPLTVRFSSSARDPDGDALLYDWTFGDGEGAGGEAATHTYAAAGTYTATITVTDARGATGSATVEVVVSGAQGLAAPPPASAGDAPAAADATPAWFGLQRPARTTLSRFARRGLQVTVTCTDAMSGSASLKVTRREARRLGLKTRTLASRPVRCALPGTESVTLKPSRRIRRALATAERSVRASLDVRMGVAGEPAKAATRRVSLRR